LADIARLRDFVADFTRLIDRTNGDEGKVLRAGRRLVADLIRVDDWLPAMFAQPRRSRYQQYLLHCDPAFPVENWLYGYEISPPTRRRWWS
jgi:predicted metal-dependent enzyme (double-stranded beta helix superfamily)